MLAVVITVGIFIDDNNIIDNIIKYNQLQNEIEEMKERIEAKRDEIDELEDMIKELDKKIEQLKKEELFGRSGKIVWEGTEKAVKASKGK